MEQGHFYICLLNIPTITHCINAYIIAGSEALVEWSTSHQKVTGLVPNVPAHVLKCPWERH